ncbi:unnamed protein product, partial [Polarella glacialis]
LALAGQILVVLGGLSDEGKQCERSVRLSGFPPHLDWLNHEFVDTGRQHEGYVIYKLNESEVEVQQPPLYLTFVRCPASAWQGWTITGNYSQCERTFAVYGMKQQVYNDQRRILSFTHWLIPSETGFTSNPWVYAQPGLVPHVGCHPMARLGGQQRLRTAFLFHERAIHLGEDFKMTLSDLGTFGDHGRRPTEDSPCWTPGYHPKMCCQPPAGSFHACFTGRHSAEDCCRDIVNRTLPDEHVAHSVSDVKPLADSFRVDIVVRAFWREQVMLEMLAESIRVFWPLELWQSKVIFVMDAESELDHTVCAGMQFSFVECRFEALPPAFGDFADFNLTGVHRAMWSLFLADHYSDADYVAIMDADSLVHTFGVPRLLFDRTGDSPKPILSGDWGVLYLFNPLVLDLDWTAEFMHSYPFTVRRRDFAEMRGFISRKMGEQDFDRAYLLLLRRLAHASYQSNWWNQYQMEGISFHAIAGSYLWNHARDSYFWSIRNGGFIGVPTAHTCPSLFVATHMAEGLEGPEASKSGRIGRTGSSFPIAYRAKAYAIMEMGLDRTAADPRALHDLVFSPRAGTVWDFPLGSRGAWQDEYASHCVHRNLSSLWQAYLQLDFEAEKAQAYSRLYGQGGTPRKT